MNELTPYVYRYSFRPLDRELRRYRANVRFARDAETGAADTLAALQRHYLPAEQLELHAFEPVPLFNPITAQWPTLYELAQAGTGLQMAYHGPLDLELATALLADLRNATHDDGSPLADAAELVQCGDGYNIAIEFNLYYH